MHEGPEGAFCVANVSKIGYTIYMPGPKPDEKKDAKVLMLRHQRVSFREIGRRLGIKESTAHFRYKRAMRQLSPVLHPTPIDSR